MSSKLPRARWRDKNGCVFTLLRWLFRLAVLVVVVYFAATVPLGSKTLIGHLRALASTKEAKDLGEGVKEKAGELGEKVKREIEDPPPEGDAPATREDGRQAHKGPGARHSSGQESGAPVAGSR
jgi:hypothetical protein